MRSRRNAHLAFALLAIASCRSTPPVEVSKKNGEPELTQDTKRAAEPAGPAIREPASFAGNRADPVVPSRAGPTVDGSLTTRWRLRESGDARDQDTYGLLAVDVGDALKDRVSGRLLARLSADVDGRGDDASQQRFGSLQDTHGKSAYLDLYEASAQIRRPFDAPLNARIGRQVDYSTPEFAHFDGVRLASDPIGKARVEVGVFGGVPVRLYEATTIENQIGGAWAEARPWKGGRVRADWMSVHQDTASSDHDDDLVGVALWQRLGESARLDARYSRLEDTDRDVRLGATWQDPDGDLLIQGQFFRLLNPLRQFASEFDPFYETLQQFEPYDQYRLLVSKSLGDRLRLDVGGDLRRLDDAGDEGRLNHDYDRGYATLVVTDVFTDALDLSLSGDSWSSDDRDIRTWGVDLTWRPDPSWRMSTGSAYSLYKYDVLADVERDDVRTWYARVRKTVSSTWTVDLEFDYEDDDFDDYQEILAGATWHF